LEILSNLCYVDEQLILIELTPSKYLLYLFPHLSLRFTRSRRLLKWIVRRRYTYSLWTEPIYLVQIRFANRSATKHLSDKTLSAMGVSDTRIILPQWRIRGNGKGKRRWKWSWSKFGSEFLTVHRSVTLIIRLWVLGLVVFPLFSYFWQPVFAGLGQLLGDFSLRSQLAARATCTCTDSFSGLLSLSPILSSDLSLGNSLLWAWPADLFVILARGQSPLSDAKVHRRF